MFCTAFTLPVDFYFFISPWNNEDVKASPKGTMEMEFLEHQCCCHVDTHSIATLCCPASQGDAAPAPLLALAVQCQLLAPGNVIPSIPGGKNIETNPSKEGTRRDISILRFSLRICRFLDFPEPFLGFFLVFFLNYVVKILQRTKVNKTKTIN